MKFYPGSIVFKRLGHLCVVFTIGFNLFLDKIQNQFLEAGEEMIEVSDTLSNTAVYSAELIKEYIFPIYDFLEKPNMEWFRSEVGTLIPNKKAIKDEVHNVYRFRDVLNVFAPLFKKAATIIRWTSHLIWIPIGISLLWLFFDLKYGKAKPFVILVMLVSIPTNLYVFRKLNMLFEFGDTIMQFQH